MARFNTDNMDAPSPPRVLGRKVIRLRKPQSCCICRAMIPAGQHARSTAMIDVDGDGKPYRFYEHTEPCWDRT